MLKNTEIRRLFIGLAIYIIIFLFLFINAAYACDTLVISLSWQPPVVNVDGSDATDIEGYIVYYWKDGDNYAEGFNIGNVTSYQFEKTNNEKTYNYAVTAYDKAGNESNYSNVVQKVSSYN